MSNLETVLIQALLETNVEFDKKGYLSEQERIENSVQLSLLEADTSLYNIEHMLDYVLQKEE